MDRRVTVEGVEEVPEDARVCHYDELGEAAKEQFPDLLTGERERVDAGTAAGFCGCDLVKFTEYYRVDVR